MHHYKSDHVKQILFSSLRALVKSNGDRIRIYESIFVLASLILTSCQTAKIPANYHGAYSKKAPSASIKAYVPTEKDSAPKGPVPTKFKAVKPKAEPLSRYGNPMHYRVDGRSYNVMTSATGYRTRGVASWYGTKFHSKRTSSGEGYDMYALTAAHKTLPLPTYVRVKNLENGRVAIVKVNDRGPFHSDRIMDLSYGAAVKLGIFPKGTARVEIEALTAKGTPQAHYYLQAGAFSSNKFAEALQQRLSHMTPSPVFIARDKQRYLVRVGPFADRAMTERLHRLLESKGVKGSFSLILNSA